jgi:hypothetical protein
MENMQQTTNEGQQAATGEGQQAAAGEGQQAAAGEGQQVATGDQEQATQRALEAALTQVAQQAVEAALAQVAIPIAKEKPKAAERRRRQEATASLVKEGKGLPLKASSPEIAAWTQAVSDRMDQLASAERAAKRGTPAPVDQASIQGITVGKVEALMGVDHNRAQGIVSAFVACGILTEQSRVRVGSGAGAPVKVYAKAQNYAAKLADLLGTIAA